MNRSDNIRFML